MGLPPGTRLGSYEIVAHLGSGGMGEVYRARDPRLGRDVAIKVLPQQEGGSPRSRERFIREARAASALNHPNIITIHEIGADQGTDFIVMEYVRGHTLAEAMRSGRLGLSQTLAFAVQIAEGLAKAHSSGIVHRDLKPMNIMVTEDRLIKILDFGLAKVGAADDTKADEQPTQAVLTRVGTTMGTIGYMSPEQALGANVDARSDVFSFGVILFELLSGRRPFEGKTETEVLRRLHLVDPPFETIRSDAPPTLVAMMRRCLAKEPDDRYPSMTAVSDVLKTLSVPHSDPELPATPPEPGHQARAAVAWMPRRAIWIVLIAATLAAVWLVRLGPWRAASGADRASAAPAAGETAYELSSNAATHLVRQDREAEVTEAIDLLERALQADPAYAPAYAHLSEAYYRRFKMSPDPQWLKLARDRAERAVALNPDLASGHLALGLVELDAGASESAMRHVERAAELDPLNPFVHMGIGQSLAAAKRDTEAEAAFRKAVELGADQWRPHTDFGQFLYQRARFVDAIESWERARAITPDNLLVLRNLGAAYYRARRYDDAASVLQRALEIRPSGSVYTNLGNIYFQQGRHTEAVLAFEKALEQDANNYSYWGNLGDAYRWAAGRRPDAAAAYRRASELLREQLALKPADAEMRTRLALYVAKAGDTQSAVKELSLLGDATLTAQMLFRVAVVRELAGDRTGALDALARALKAGYPATELGAEPELSTLRTDPRYHRLVSVTPPPTGG